MRVALTGTPGTGKSTVAALLPYRIIDINALVKGGLNLGIDPERDCLEADMERLERRLDELDSIADSNSMGRTDVSDITVIEGHISHYFADSAIVLRLDPKELKKRLQSRGYSEKKVRENLESEALDVILIEAVEFCDRVDEINTTGRSPAEVADLVIKIVQGKIRQPPGQVSWLEDFIDSGWAEG
ncbi:MAG: adenylate kinase family protein [Methanotrichaceae archaeon]